MRPICVIWILLFSLIYLTGCQPEEYIFVEVIITQGSPPVFRLSEDEGFETPAYVNSIKVFSDEEGSEYKFFWAIAGHRREVRDSKVIDIIGVSIPIWEVVYGVLPEGFKESEKLLALEPDAEYRLEVDGRPSGTAVVYFTNTPGRYFGQTPL